jgi:hypothetical protein
MTKAREGSQDLDSHRKFSTYSTGGESSGESVYGCLPVVPISESKPAWDESEGCGVWCGLDLLADHHLGNDEARREDGAAEPARERQGQALLLLALPIWPTPTPREVRWLLYLPSLDAAFSSAKRISPPPHPHQPARTDGEQHEGDGQEHPVPPGIHLWLAPARVPAAGWAPAEGRDQPTFWRYYQDCCLLEVRFIFIGWFDRHASTDLVGSSRKPAR